MMKPIATIVTMHIYTGLIMMMMINNVEIVSTSPTSTPTSPPPNDTMDHQYDMLKNDHALEQLINSAAGGNVYRLLRYHVTTDDGYILLLHRVVERAEWAAAMNDSMVYCRKRKPMIAAHGMTGSSMSFFINTPPLTTTTDSSVFDDDEDDEAENELEDDDDDDNQVNPKRGAPHNHHQHLHYNHHNRTCGDNFGFCLLATGRYDLWLPNYRGSPFSLRHRSLSPQNDAEFWKFSFDEMAREDLPAVLKRIIADTGHQTVGYVGFSQGFTIAISLLALQPEYADHIRPLIGWAPAVYLHNQQTPLRYLTPVLPFYQRLPFSTLTQSMIDSAQHILCYHVTSLCGDVFFSIGGASNHLNRSRIESYLPHFNLTQLAFTNEVPHFVQLMHSQSFRRFNYGMVENLRRYYRPIAPEYPLYRIPADYPVVLFGGQTDAFVTTTDVELLVKNLRDISHANVTHHLVDSALWNHFDFILGMNAGRLVYSDTIKYLDRLIGD